MNRGTATADEPLDRAIAQVEAAQAGGAPGMQIKAFLDRASFTFSYVVHDEATRRAAIVDPVLDFDPDSGRTSTASAEALLAYASAQGLVVDWLLETHAHADHLSAAPFLQEKLGGQIAIGERITLVQQVFGKLFNAGAEFRRDGADFDRLFADGDAFHIGSLPACVLHVPGHTPACVAYVVGDAVFVGDTIFMPDYGTARADFPGGDARRLFRSLRRVLALPPPTRMFVCHDYLPEGRSAFRWETTVGEQRAHNIHAHDAVSEEEFVAMREARDTSLAVPRLILPSVQVNMRAGRLPPPEDNGLIYLKLPVNAL